MLVARITPANVSPYRRAMWCTGAGASCDGKGVYAFVLGAEVTHTFGCGSFDPDDYHEVTEPCTVEFLMRQFHCAPSDRERGRRGMFGDTITVFEVDEEDVYSRFPGRYANFYGDWDDCTYIPEVYVHVPYQEDEPYQEWDC